MKSMRLWCSHGDGPDNGAWTCSGGTGPHHKGLSDNVSALNWTENTAFQYAESVVVQMAHE